MTVPRRVALVGLGAISRFYLAAIDASPAWELAAVCDLARDRLAPWRGRTACFDDHAALLRDTAGGLDAVIVAAPNDVHFRIAHDTLSFGLPVCLEKPLALEVAEGERLEGLARARGLCVFTAFHRRYNSAVRALARSADGHGVRSLTVRYLERIEDHVLGDRWYLDPRRCGGGCVADNGPNAFDLVRLLIGDVEVRDARVGRDGTGVDRTAYVRLVSGSGAKATVELDWSYPGEIKDVEMTLDDGRCLRADMLAGHSGFKQSLWHEYEGVLDGFAAALAPRPGRADGGLPALRLVGDAYRTAAMSAAVR